MSQRTAILLTGLLAQACFYQPELPAAPGGSTSTGMTAGATTTGVGGTVTTTGEPTGDATTSGTTAASGPACGNGVLEADEQCDDGNDADDDECVAGCVLATCGDGHVGPGEACDPLGDPNCSPDCKPPLCDGAKINPELGEECDGANIGACTKACDYDCTCAYCGDNTISVELAEACDDGDAGAGDACSADCSLNTEVIDIGVGNTHVCVVFASGVIRCWGANGAIVNGAFVRDFRLGPGSEAIDRRGDGSADGMMPAPNIVVEGRSFARVDGGEGFSCAVAVEPGDVAGDVYCWGSNSAGQLGVDPTDIASSSEPLLVKGLGGQSFTDIAGGNKHACAIRSDGRVLCWGAPANNVLGKNFFNDAGQWSPPIEVPMPADITAQQITAGLAHTCVLAREGKNVICWGFSDNYGVLGVNVGFGNGGNVASWLPVNVISPNESVVEIASGRRHVCALTNKGGVRCWGSNIHGQLGTNNNTSVAFFAQPPADVLVGSASAGMTTGAGHTCARIAGQGAKCWGEGGYGQIGTGTKVDLLAPDNSYANLKSKSVKMISAHLGQFSCALFEDLTMSCWGSNSDGQLGYDNIDNVGDDPDESIAGILF